MLLLILKILFVPLLSPAIIGIIRKIKAVMQNREGASIIQPYYDLWKLFHKDEIIPTDASWIFRLSPFLIFGISIIISLGIPLISSTEVLAYFGDFIVLIYLIATMTFFLSLAGMDTGSFFGGFGASREMTINALTEGGLLFAFLPVALLCQSTNIISMTTIAQHLPVSMYLPVLISFGGFFISLMAETGRIPFDNPATHLELTMIHEAMILEYSGKRLALIEWANANKVLFFAILGANIFFPWGITSEKDVLSLFMALGFTLGKVLLIVSAVAVLESSIAKFRFFRLPDLLMTGFIFSVIALIIIGI